jgi:hypothetical protein
MDRLFFFDPFEKVSASRFLSMRSKCCSEKYPLEKVEKVE